MSESSKIDKIFVNASLVAAAGYVLFGGYGEAMARSEPLLASLFGTFCAVGSAWLFSVSVYFLGVSPFVSRPTLAIREAVLLFVLSWLLLLGTLAVSSEEARIELFWLFFLLGELFRD